MYLTNFKEREFLRFLKENEQYINENDYRMCIEMFIEEIVKNDKTVQSLFNNFLSEKQEEIILNFLKQNNRYKDLAFAFLIWKRDMIKGVGFGLQLNNLV